MKLPEADKGMKLEISYICDAIELIRVQEKETGIVDCPKCSDGKLSYSVHSNDHIWGKCTTHGCLDWGM